MQSCTFHLSISRVVAKMIGTHERRRQFDHECQDREREGQDLKDRDIYDDSDKWSRVVPRAKISDPSGTKSEKRCMMPAGPRVPPLDRQSPEHNEQGSSHDVPEEFAVKESPYRGWCQLPATFGREFSPQSISIRQSSPSNLEARYRETHTSQT